MSCTCLCHNAFAAEQGKTPHAVADCACTKDTNATKRTQVDLCYTIEEQLKQKAKLEEVMRLIAAQEPHATEENAQPLITLQHVVQWAKDAAAPSILCRSCRTLTPVLPCVHCGNASA